MSLFSFLAPISSDSFAVELTNDINTLVGRLNTSSGTNRNFPNCTILNNYVFENFILAYETFAKALQIFETCV